MLRLKWYVKKEWIEQNKEEEIIASIDALIHYQIKGLLNQTNQDFVGFIQYPKGVEKLLLDRIQVANIIIPPNIILTEELRIDIRNQFTWEYLERYDQIIFVHMNPKQLYHKGFVEELKNYDIPKKIRILMFKEYYQYCLKNEMLYENIDDEKDIANYGYVCRVDEYFKHLCVYDYYFPEVIERNYKRIPHHYYEKKVVLSLQESEKSIRSDNTLKLVETNSANIILKEFIQCEV